ncbi:MAG: cytochrome c maturation protein CcmE [Firmicutes bacterium]|uniref:Cytochrome c maturation protein CcmE n=1 Tax=Geochorda subterranea TaxID=3109564 RepID=A0ABZ1BR10_9FIRM|nr:cytochrome c maturation protein CcmE [Limnochorda sp. LNt]NLG69233.1 cytochrome c maturation protein CcmE [Bacillota bacterium]WRP15184.1 cytochrome c maturation protein CcmE [Limnochorda sp. LNt]
MARQATSRWRLWVGALLVVGATAYLMGTAFHGATTYYLSADEALARAAGQRESLAVRVRGRVTPGTLQFDAVQSTLRFVLGPDETGAPEASARAAVAPGPSGAPARGIDVVYRGAPPDNLQEGSPVIVEGRLRAEGRLEATQVLVQCPSRYEADR